MADLSLDDYIQQKGPNFRVQIRNPNAGPGGTTIGRGRGKGNMRGRGRGNMSVRLGQRTVNAHGQGRGIVQLNKKQQIVSINRSGPLTTKKFDARDKLASRNRPLDARVKLDSKVRDARKRLTNMRLQKGTLDARALIKIKNKNKDAPKSANSGGANGNLANDFSITRNSVGTVSNPALAAVQMSDGGLQITRSVAPSVGGMTGNTCNFKITKNVAHSQPIVSQSPKFNLLGPQLIQIHNDQYRSQPQPQPQPQIIVRSSFDDYEYEQGYDTEYDFIREQEASFIAPVTRIATSAPVIRAPITGPMRHVPINAPLFQKTFRQTGPLQIQKQTVVAKKSPMLITMNTTGVKRKAPDSAGPLRLFGSGPLKFPNTVPSKPQSSGPLKLAGSGQKVAKAGAMKRIPPKKIKVMEEVYDDDEDDEEMDEVTEQPDIGVISPLQGYRVMITNLHTTVTQDDIVELFGCIGSVKRAKLMKPGMGEVVYVKKEDALAAVQKYHNRELDDKPMHVNFLTSATAKVKQDVLPPADKPSGEPLKLAKPLKGQVISESRSSVDVSLLHRALFKTSTGGLPPKPVKFTVKI